MAKKAAKKPAKKKAGTAVAVHKPQLPATPRSFLEMLHAIATDRSVDVAKMQAVLDMRAQEEARDAKREFDHQMAEMQPLLPRVSKQGLITITDKADKEKIIQRTPYARWEDIHKVIMPILNRHKFSLTYRVGQAADGKVTVTAVLGHAGHREETTITLMADVSGSKNNVQGVGSSISYGKRYTAAALLNLTFGGEDDDGNGGGGAAVPKTISPDQVKRIQTLMTATNTPATRVLDYASKLSKAEIDTINDIPVKCFSDVVAQLEARKASK